MKIIHVIFSLANGGAENLLADIINEQALHHNVSLLIVNNKVDTGLVNRIHKKVKIFRFDREPGKFSFKIFLRINLCIWKISPDYIHCHNENLIGLLFPIFWGKTGLTLHDTFLKETNLKYLPLYHHLFAISKAVQLYGKKISGLDFILNYNGVDSTAIPSRKSEIRSNPFRIVQVSRLVHEKKGQDILIKAIFELERAGYGVEVDFIGEGDSEIYLQQLVRQFKLEKTIRFLGNLQRSEVYQLLPHYDLLIQPSLYEGFGLTIAEAMMAKVPVLTSNLEGPVEIIQYGKYGYLFDVGNVPELTEKIRYIIDNYKEVWETNIKAQQYAKDNFDVRGTALRYLDLYNN